MGYFELLVHIFKENHMVFWKFLYLDFGHLSDTPTLRVTFGKGCPTAQIVQFSQKM